MKLRTAVMLATVVLLPAGARAQGTTAPVTLTQALVTKMVPLMRAQLTSATALERALRTSGMSKTTYVANRNAIVVAMLDRGDPTRLTRRAIFVQVRKINMEVLRAIQDSMPTFGEDFGHVGDDTATTGLPNPCLLCTSF